MTTWNEFADGVMAQISHDTSADFSSYRRNALRIWNILKRPEMRSNSIRISEISIETETNTILSEIDNIPGIVARRWATLPADNFPSRASFVFALARALDKHIYELPLRSLGSDKAIVYEINAGNELGAGFFIPFPPIKNERGVRGVQPRANPISRGFLNHRILPKQLDTGRQLNVQFLRGADGIHDLNNAIKLPKLAGALFNGLELDLSISDRSFVASNVKTENYFEQIDSHIEFARNQECEFLLFPELTINSVARNYIVKRLNDGVADGRSAIPKNPMCTIAGSWHESFDSQRFENIAPIFDRWGKRIAEHKKFLPYFGNATGFEDIIPGSDITCLVTKSGIFAIAICLDFCDAASRPEYPEIDADGILVISMGNLQTMEGHVMNARQCYLAWRGRTFVVQQLDTPFPPQLGFILRAESPPPRKKMSTSMDKKETDPADPWDAKNTSTSQAWHLWDWAKRS